MRNVEWKTHRYRQQWPQDTERRPAKH